MILMLGAVLKDQEEDHKNGWGFSSKGGRYSAWLLCHVRKGSPAMPRGGIRLDRAALYPCIYLLLISI